MGSLIIVLLSWYGIERADVVIISSVRIRVYLETGMNGLKTEPAQRASPEHV